MRHGDDILVDGKRTGEHESTDNITSIRHVTRQATRPRSRAHHNQPSTRNSVGLIRSDHSESQFTELAECCYQPINTQIQRGKRDSPSNNQCTSALLFNIASKFSSTKDISSAGGQLRTSFTLQARWPSMTSSRHGVQHNPRSLRYLAYNPGRVPTKSGSLSTAKHRCQTTLLQVHQAAGTNSFTILDSL